MLKNPSKTHYSIPKQMPEGKTPLFSIRILLLWWKHHSNREPFKIIKIGDSPFNDDKTTHLITIHQEPLAAWAPAATCFWRRRYPRGSGSRSCHKGPGRRGTAGGEVDVDTILHTYIYINVIFYVYIYICIYTRHLSIDLSIDLSVYLSIYLSI